MLKNGHSKVLNNNTCKHVACDRETKPYKYVGIKQYTNQI